MAKRAYNQISNASSKKRKRVKLSAALASNARRTATRGGLFYGYRGVPRSVGIRGTPFPARQRCTLTYCDHFSITTDGSGKGYYAYHCNGLYDPQIATGGHQPRYFDQLMSIYNHYHVANSTCTFTFWWRPNESGVSQTNAIIMSAYVDDDGSTGSTNSYDQMERPGAVTLTIGPHSMLGESGRRSVTKTWSYKKHFGGDLLANNALGGNIAANPTEGSAFILSVLESIGVQTLNFHVKITYDAIFTELKEIAAS